MTGTIVAIFTVAALATPTAAAYPDDDLVYQMEPLPHELLGKPIRAPKCPVSIVEWRGSDGKPFTAPSKKGTAVVNATCEFVVEVFPAFIAKHGFKLYAPPEIVIGKASLIPFDADGMDLRNLNDIQWRFRSRPKVYDSDRALLSVYGYTDRNQNAIYLRNDVLTKNGKPNPEFIETWAHELFHYLSNQTIWDELGETHEARAEKDEELAQAFTEYLGLAR